MEQRPTSSLQRTIIGILRVGWIVTTLILLAIFVAGLIPRFNELNAVCDGEDCLALVLPSASADILANAGLTVAHYAAFHILVEIAAAASFLFSALFIFWKLSHTWIGLLVAYTLIMFGLNFFVEADGALLRLYPALDGGLTFLNALTGLPFVLLLYVFPNGRFVPRWSRYLILLLVLVTAAEPFFAAAGEVVRSGTFSFIYAAASSAAILIGVVAQVYRYRRRSTPVERQQTKWVMLGFAGILFMSLIWNLFIEVAPPPPGMPRLLIDVGFFAAVIWILIAFPLSFVFSMMRYRLWDVDLIIRRTVVYGLLTVSLIIVYFGAVVVLQSLLSTLTGQDSPVVIVISTLLIAALFTPLRRRVQDVIDRRFFRQKYDAEQILARFAQIARDETDLQELSDELLLTVRETVHPDQANLWLRE